MNIAIDQIKLSERDIREQTGKTVYGKVICGDTPEEGEHYRIIYDRKGDISRQNGIDLLRAHCCHAKAAGGSRLCGG